MSAKKRKTLNKAIAQAPTLAQKWQTAIAAGNPLSAIEQLADDALMLREVSARGCAHGPEWVKEAEASLKQRFADLMFPAFFKRDRKAFKQLIAALTVSRLHSIARVEDLPAKAQQGRHLRQILLSMEPEHRASVRTVLLFLKEAKAEFSDESHVRRVMKELGICLLQPGQICQWSIGGKIIRQILVKADGTLSYRRLSRAALAKLSGAPHYVETIPPGTPTLPDK